MKLLTLELENFTGYRYAKFDFGSRGQINPVSVFYGPNGCGKSTGLHAIRLISSPGSLKNRENDLLFRRLTFHPDYDPTLPHFMKHDAPMRVKGVFVIDGEEKVVELSSENSEKSDGLVQCDISVRNVGVFVDADHTINRGKFSLPEESADLFLEMAEIVYGYKVSLGKKVGTYEERGKQYSGSGECWQTYQDVVIDKGDVRVHFKSMSDGERKIATLLRQLCDPDVIKGSGIVLVDNIEMHVYFERHARMMDKLIESFPDIQFIVTSHSGILINHIRDKYGEKCLFNVPEIKGQKMID